MATAAGGQEGGGLDRGHRGEAASPESDRLLLISTLLLLLHSNSNSNINSNSNNVNDDNSSSILGAP